MNIRLLTPNDIDSVMEIINDAKKLLSKNSLQWQQGYPNIDTMLNDITSCSCFGLFNEENCLVAIASLIKGIDPNYLDIEGKWQNYPSTNDLQIHRIAVREGYHRKKLGDTLMKFAIDKAKEYHCTSIKIDTHKVNYPMQHLCLNNGFVYRGIITLKRDEIDPTRLAYELTI
ncbi:MAG: GNAT family N-acetyltransferase [Bacilli bacterium]